MGQKLMELFGKEVLVVMGWTAILVAVAMGLLFLWLVPALDVALTEMKGWYLWEWITNGPPA